MSSAHTSRRGLVGAGLAILATGAAAGVAGGPLLPGQPDGELVAACGEYLRLRAIQRRDDREDYLSDDEACALAQAVYDQMALLEGMAPQTREGRRAKAAAVHDALLNKLYQLVAIDWREQADLPERLAVDLLANIAAEV